MQKLFVIGSMFFAVAIFAMEHVPDIFKDRLPKGVKVYLESLPKISTLKDDADCVEKSKAITDYLLQFGGYNTDVDGRDIVENKILNAVQAQEPIRRILPAFPVSSANPNKIPFDDEHSFGLGDLLALLTRNHISREISKIHRQGSTVTIFWEPFIDDMNQVVMSKIGVPLFSASRIYNYREALRDMVNYLDPYVTIGRLPGNKLETVYKDTYRDLKVAIEPDKLKDYVTFVESELDNPEMKKQLSSAKKEVAKSIAETAYTGSKKVALMLQQEIPDYKKQIRESVRPNPLSVKDKIGTPMIYGTMGTPWHKTLVVDKDGVNLDLYKKLRDDKEMKLTYATIEGEKQQPPHDLYYVGTTKKKNFKEKK